MTTRASIGGHSILSIINFLSGYKKNNKKRQQKEVQIKIARKRCRSRKAIFGPSKYIQFSLLQTQKMWYWLSH